MNSSLSMGSGTSCIHNIYIGLIICRYSVLWLYPAQLNANVVVPKVVLRNDGMIRKKNMQNSTNYIKLEYYHFRFMIQKSKKSCPCKRHLVHTCCKTGTPLPRTKGENLPVTDRAIRNPQDNNSVIAFKGAFREFLWQHISTNRYQKHQELQIVDDLDEWNFCSRSTLEEHSFKSKCLVYHEI